MNIGENIRKIRKIKGLTMKELGIKVGISEQGIGNYERGDRKPDFEVMDNIAYALGCPLSDLLGVEPSQNNPNYFNNYLKSLGYEIIYDENDSYLVLKSNAEEYEITENDINDLKASSKSFVEFKLHEIIEHSRKIGK